MSTYDLNRGSSSLELGEAEIRILKFTISMSTPVTILPLHPTGLVTVPEGASLKVYCQADGTPLPTLQWNRNFQPLNPRMIERQQLNVSTNRIGTSTLRFLNIKHEDSASYSCQASNKHGQVQKSVRIRVTRTTTVPTTPRSLCDQIPTYCLHGRCVTGLGSRQGFVCLCSENYEGVRCDKLITSKNHLQVKSPDESRNLNECVGGNCSWTSNYLFFYIAFGFLVFILGLLLLIFLLQRRRRNQLRQLTSFSKIHEKKSRTDVRPSILDANSYERALQTEPLARHQYIENSNTKLLTTNFDLSTKSFCRECETNMATIGPKFKSSCTQYPQHLYHPHIQTSATSTLTTSKIPTHSLDHSYLTGPRLNPSNTSMLVHPCIYLDSPQLLPLYSLENKQPCHEETTCPTQIEDKPINDIPLYHGHMC